MMKPVLSAFILRESISESAGMSGAGQQHRIFSATLLPVNYYKNLLSSKKDNYAVYADSAFREEQRLLFIGRDVSSLYTRRTIGEFRRIALYIQQVLRAKKGNYLIFFPVLSVYGGCV